MTVRKNIIVAAVVLACFSWSGVAFAHTTGKSWNIPEGDYTVDVGYDPPTFVAGNYTRFDFLLWKGPANTGEPADYSQIWIRIIGSEKDTLLAAGVWRQPIGPTTLLFEFVDPGIYTLEVSYRNADGDDIADASFPITVNGGTRSSTGVKTFIVPLVTLVLGAGVGALAMRSRSR